jgi:hypothetical protein
MKSDASRGFSHLKEMFDFYFTADGGGTDEESIYSRQAYTVEASQRLEVVTF